MKSKTADATGFSFIRYKVSRFDQHFNILDALCGSRTSSSQFSVSALYRALFQFALWPFAELHSRTHMITITHYHCSLAEQDQLKTGDIS
jgi:hypothetical protein